jgi:serine/threonine protein kinase
MAERQFGPYRLVRQIAVGGMAEIHLAKTKGIAGFEKYVALKMIHPNFAEDEQFIQMLVDEAKIAVQLTHGNIAQTFDLGRVGDTFYITMEYVDGADLYRILRRASEIDVETPLDVCAFVGKEIASALDHAHRKRDHMGKNLGIVHRDVSPQNVLISYSGEVKLVDFGIAKATMKARQTAVGVIKGKYYYMSPEQAWGEVIDYRSDIFSAGIVLYEMITGQMLYLEEDLHRLLDMARRAAIASPTTLRKGIPPQLEKIVMRALQKKKEDRYQSASDFASDLERFLHTYSPVFTAAKLSSLLRKVVGEPEPVPQFAIELNDGPESTHQLTADDLIHTKDEIRDENSVIFRVAELKPKKTPVGPMPAGRVTRQADIKDLPPRAPTPPSGGVKVPAIARPAARPRNPDEETRETSPVPPGPDDDVEHTMITGAPGAMGGPFMDVAGEEGVDATMISGAPEPESDTSDDDVPTEDVDRETIQRDFRDRKPQFERRGPAEPALAAKIHAPAVSELRKPRASRKTPGAGVPQPNVLQQIVAAQPSEPLPVPRQPRNEDSNATTMPERAPNGAYGNDASGLPLAMSTPLPGQSMPMAPAAPPQQQYGTHGYPQLAPAQYAQYPQAQQYPQQQMPQQPYPHPQTPPQPFAPVSPGGLYQFQPYGAPAPQPMSLTGQMRLFEVDEIPSQYRVSSGNGRVLKLVIAGVIAVSVAAGTTFFIIKSTRDMAPSFATIDVESIPKGAEVSYDGTKLAGLTPMHIDKVPLGTRHEIKVELARHKPFVDNVDIPKNGGEVTVNAALKPITGKLVVVTQPDGAEIRIDGQLRGRAPTTINDIDMASAKTVELRLKDYQPYIQNLEWPANGEIDIDKKLQK